MGQNQQINGPGIQHSQLKIVGHYYVSPSDMVFPHNGHTRDIQDFVCIIVVHVLLHLDYAIN